MLEVRPGRSRRRHKRPGNRKWALALVCLFAIALVAAGGMTAYRAQRVATSATGIPEEILVGQQMVRQNIKGEFKSHFAPVNETVVERLPGNKIRVAGWVDVMTGTGVADRQNYSVVIFRDGAGDWEGEQLSIMPQM